MPSPLSGIFVKRLSPMSAINMQEADMTDNEKLIPPRGVLAFFEPSPTVRTLDRWLADPRIGFPRPVRIGKTRYFREREIQDFIARKARERIATTSQATN
jgi:predicted DNA-binding transcriptional regulator AlpA